MGNQWNGPVVGSQASLPEPKLLVKTYLTFSLREGGERQEAISGDSLHKVMPFSKIANQ